MERTHFKVIVPMYNCARYATACLDSVLSQKYGNWELVVCVDPSEDGTYDIVYKYLLGKDHVNVTLVRNNVRQYVPKNFLDCIRMNAPSNEDVMVLVDGDDQLAGPDVLSYLESIYGDENVWITWGSYAFAHNKQVGLASQPLLPDYRKRLREWRYSHLKTFRYFLFKGIQDTDCRDSQTGDYYTVASDMVLMFPMVEMAGPEHCRFIEKVLYLYNHNNPINDDRVNGRLLKRCDWEIRNRPQYASRSKEFLCGLA